MSADQHQRGVQRHAVLAYAGYEVEMTAEGRSGGKLQDHHWLFESPSVLTYS